MAIALAVNNIVQTRMYCTLDNQVSINSLFFLVNSIGTPAATDADVATFMDTAVGAAIKAMLPTASEYRGFQAQIVWPNPRRPAQTGNAGAGAGTVASDPLPTQVTGLVFLTSNIAGPGGRGRIYLPFPTESQNDASGLPTAGYQTLAGAVITAWFGASAIAEGGRTANLVPVLYKRSAHTTTQLITGGVRAKWATQRRRGDYGRPNISPI